MNIFDVALILLFSLWLLLTFIAQTSPKKIIRLRSKDVFHLIPNWRFFAPVPARKDYHLEYREQDARFETTKWNRIMFSPPRTAWCILWYPQKRYRKAFNTCVRRIIKMQKEYGYRGAL